MIKLTVAGWVITGHNTGTTPTEAPIGLHIISSKVMFTLLSILNFTSVASNMHFCESNVYQLAPMFFGQISN